VSHNQENPFDYYEGKIDLIEPIDLSDRWFDEPPPEDYYLLNNTELRELKQCHDDYDWPEVEDNHVSEE
jgi:hypothetical protein